MSWVALCKAQCITRALLPAVYKAQGTGDRTGSQAHIPGLACSTKRIPSVLHAQEQARNEPEGLPMTGGSDIRTSFCSTGPQPITSAGWPEVAKA